MSASGGMALYVGLNPAVQRRVVVDGLAVGSVNRAKESSTGIGGKGQGGYVAALRLAEQGAGPAPRLCMFLGSGREGDMLANLLRQRGEEADGPLWVRTAAPCRICTTIVDLATDGATEIVEPSGSLVAAEWDAMLSGLGAAVPPDGVEALAIMGTAPPGTPADMYEQIARRAAGPRTKVLMDSVVNLTGALRAAADAVCGGSGGVVLKLNAREVLQLAGQKLVGSDSEVRAEPGEVESVCLALAEQVAAGAGSGSRGLDYVCYTDGPFPGGVVAIRSGRRWRLAQTQPLPRKLVSPIGAGDSTSAGTLHAWCRGDGAAQDEAMVEAFRFGIAVGAASCLTAENGVFDMADVRQIFESIEVTEVGVA